MKKLIALAAVATMAWSAFGQGTVDFRNQSSVLGTANDYLVKFASDNSPVVNVGTSTYVAQLWYGPAGTAEGSLTALAGAPSNFRAPTTTLPGTWSGGSKSLPGFALGQTAVLQVRVWDTSLAADWATASAAGYTGQLGKSALFDFSFFQSSPPATTDDDMVNFRGFTIDLVPEPSTFALLGLGTLGMLIFRRK